MEVFIVKKISLCLVSPSLSLFSPSMKILSHKMLNMFKFWSVWCMNSVLLLLLLWATLASGDGSKNRTSLWQTLNGNAPVVVACGGFSGLYPDSSSLAYDFVGMLELPNVVYWCDVQLTKDEAGICFPDLRLENGSNIDRIRDYENKYNAYLVNDAYMRGWFSVDFTLNDLRNVSLRQGVTSRPNTFDGSSFILTVDDVLRKFNPPGLWLNIEHDAFFSQQNLSMGSFVLSVFRSAIVDYISSPEINFLRSILARKPNRTNIFFRFLGQDEVEPSTNQTYGSLLCNLTFIKSFASGILVPKSYIWPVDENLYLLPHTSLVLDAHAKGLKVFASDFANDVPFAYNFSYNPVAEYLSFIDNGEFSVDGVIFDSAITPSETISCFSHLDKDVSRQAAISNPYATRYGLYRNPQFKNAGNFTSLRDFLTLANTGSVSGVLLIIENAAYLEENQGLSVTDAVLDALRDASLNNRTVMIQSTNSSVLIRLKEETNYEVVYKVDEDIRDADTSAIKAIKKFADSVVVSKASVFPDAVKYLTGMTDVVKKLQAFKLKVYAEVFQNEFVSQAWDFYSDVNMETHNFVLSGAVDGIITEFPRTAVQYKRNKCSRLSKVEIPKFMLPVDNKGLASLTAPQDLPPAQALKLVSTETNVVELPQPSVVSKAGQFQPKPISSAPPPEPNLQPKHPHSLKTLRIASIIMGALVGTLAICAIIWKACQCCTGKCAQLGDSGVRR